jgi:hypothetical protein
MNGAVCVERRLVGRPDVAVTLAAGQQAKFVAEKIGESAASRPRGNKRSVLGTSH